MKAKHRLTRILQVLHIPRSTYYSYLHWQPSQTKQRHERIKKLVFKIWTDYPMYGYPRITIMLRSQLKRSISERFVYQLMTELGIRSIMTKKRNKPTTKVLYPQRPNLINDLSHFDGVLLKDITYIPVANRWVYLASVYQPETRQVIAYKLGYQMTKSLAVVPIKKALSLGYQPQIVHSDMGSQYTSDLFEQTLSSQNIKHSYSRKGRPGDNARIESFHSLLKREYVNTTKFSNMNEAIAGIDSYIRWYNHDRITLVA